MKKYKAIWANGMTKTVTAQNRYEAQRQLDGWATLRSNYLPEWWNYRLEAVETQLDKVINNVLFIAGIAGACISLRAVNANDFHIVNIGLAIIGGAIGIYQLRGRN